MLIVLLCACWLFGLWFAHITPDDRLSLPLWLLLAALSLLAAALLRRREPVASRILACLLAFCAANARWIVAQPAFEPNHIAHFNDTPQLARVGGVVSAEPDVGELSTRLRLTVDRAAIGNRPAAPAVGDLLVTVNRLPAIEYGTRLTVTGRLQQPYETPEIDYRARLAREGVFSTMRWPQLTVVATDQGNWLYARLLRFKQDAAAAINRMLPAPQSALLAAILLGDRVDLPADLAERFALTGVAHLLVISGMHIAVLMFAVVKVADRFVTRRQALFITLLFLALYALLVGLRPSVLRAVLMGSAWLVGRRLLGWRGSSLALLASVALLLTAIDPFWLLSVSFQLSFVATAAIIIYAAPADRWIKRWLRNNVGAAAAAGLPGQLISVFVVSLTVGLLVAPLTGWHFGRLPLVGLLANLLLTPLQPLILIGGSLATLCGVAIEPLGRLLAWTIWPLLVLTELVVNSLADWPGAWIAISFSSYTVLFVYSTLLAATAWMLQEPEQRLDLRQRLPRSPLQWAAVTALPLILVISWSRQQPDGLLHITFFDVGQGDAIFIETPSGRQLLIDSGQYPSLIASRLGAAMPFWDRTIDLVIATHADSDHVGALPTVFDRYDVDHLLVGDLQSSDEPLYETVLALAQQKQIAVRPVRRGEQLQFGDGVTLEILHPDRLLASDNNNSVSLRIVYHDLSVLLTGDAEAPAEQAMLQHAQPLQATVLKAGHHGSSTSSTRAFIAAVQPQFVVISVGAENRFGHPSPEVLAAFEQRGVPILRTDVHGTVELISDGRQLWWQSDR